MSLIMHAVLEPFHRVSRYKDRQGIQIHYLLYGAFSPIQVKLLVRSAHRFRRPQIMNRAPDTVDD